MAIGTFKEFKDYILIALMGVLIKFAWDIKNEVSKLHDDNIINSYEIRAMKNEINSVASESREKDKEQDKRMDDFEAILNDNNLQPKKRYASKED